MKHYMKHYCLTSVAKALSKINDIYDELENPLSVLSDLEEEEVWYLLNKVREILQRYHLHPEKQEELEKLQDLTDRNELLEQENENLINENVILEEKYMILEEKLQKLQQENKLQEFDENI